MPHAPFDHWETGDLRYLDYRELGCWLRHPVQTFRWWRAAKTTYGGKRP